MGRGPQHPQSMVQVKNEMFFQKEIREMDIKKEDGCFILYIYPLCDRFSPETERWHVNKSNSSSSGVSLSIASSKSSPDHVEWF